MKNAAEIYEKNIDGIVVVQAEDGEGSGVVVGDNLVATNAHVVDGGGRITVWPAAPGQLGGAEAKIIAASDRDLCLLETKGLPIRPVEIGAAKSLRVGDPVCVIGAPGGLGGTLSTGIVSRLWTPPKDPDILHPLRDLPGPLIQTNAAVSPGSSGGGLFDAEGRLVGIVTYGRNAGRDNLNFALPAEMIGWLTPGREEKDIRRQMDKILDRYHVVFFNTGEPLIPKILIDQARRISMILVRDSESESMFGIMTEMARAATVFGDREPAEKLIEQVLNEVAASDEIEVEDRVMAKFCKAIVLSSMGADRVDEAARLIDSLGDASVRAGGYAFIAADCARYEGRGSPKARGFYDRIEEKKVPQSPIFASAMAVAEAAMGNSEDALIRVKERIKPDESAGAFLIFVETLAEIAAALKRRGCVIGAKAVFHYAGRMAAKFNGRGVGALVRPVALGRVAVSAAECEDVSIARAMLEQMDNIRPEHDAPNLSEDGTPDIPYRWAVEARELEARVRAMIGAMTNDVVEMDKAFGTMKRIPVLERLPAALVCAACGMRRMMAKAEKE